MAETDIIWNDSNIKLPDEGVKVFVKYVKWWNGVGKEVVRMCTLQKMYTDHATNSYRLLFYFTEPLVEYPEWAVEPINTHWAYVEEGEGPGPGDDHVVLISDDGFIYTFGNENNLIILK